MVLRQSVVEHGNSILLPLLGATLSASEPQTGIEGVITVSPVNGGPARIGIPGSKPLAKRTKKAESVTMGHSKSM
jgi:hypothetical protein